MTHQLFDVEIDDLRPDELESLFFDWLTVGNASRIIVTPNAEFFLMSLRDETFRARLQAADLAVADAVAVVYAIAALTDERLVNRIAGVDLFEQIVSVCSRTSSRVLLLGGDPEAAVQTASRLRARHEADVVGYDPGLLAFDGVSVTIDADLVDYVKAINPAVVAVALGQGKQEAFMEQARQLLPDVRIWIGVGGTFELLSGQKRRAPVWMRRVGLEWLWRLTIEPSRWRRILDASIVFPIMVVLATLRERRFFKACRRVFTELVTHFYGR